MNPESWLEVGWRQGHFQPPRIVISPSWGVRMDEGKKHRYHYRNVALNNGYLSNI